MILFFEVSYGIYHRFKRVGGRVVWDIGVGSCEDKMFIVFPVIQYLQACFNSF
jgi:hypothetical protein